MGSTAQLCDAAPNFFAPQVLGHAEQNNSSSATCRHLVRWGTIAASPAFDDRIGR